MIFENNLNSNINLTHLDNIINKINTDFENKNFFKVNTRQEREMGLYKVMHMVFSVIKYGESFYISRTDNIFRVEMKLKKEIISNEKILIVDDDDYKTSKIKNLLNKKTTILKLP